MLSIIVIPSISLWTSTCSWEASERILGLWCWWSGQESRLERGAKLELSMVLILLAAWSAASWALVLNLVASHFAFTLIGTPSTLVKPLIFWLHCMLDLLSSLLGWPHFLLLCLILLMPGMFRGHIVLLWFLPNALGFLSWSRNNPVLLWTMKMFSVFKNLNEHLKKAFWLFDSYGLKAALIKIIMGMETGHFYYKLLSSRVEFLIKSHKISFATGIFRVLFQDMKKNISSNLKKNMMNLELINFSIILHDKGLLFQFQIKIKGSSSAPGKCWLFCLIKKHLNMMNGIKGWNEVS